MMHIARLGLSIAMLAITANVLADADHSIQLIGKCSSRPELVSDIKKKIAIQGNIHPTIEKVVDNFCEQEQTQKFIVTKTVTVTPHGLLKKMWAAIFKSPQQHTLEFNYSLSGTRNYPYLLETRSNK